MRLLTIYILLISLVISSCVSRNICITQPLENSFFKIEKIKVRHKPFYTKSTFGTKLTIVKVKNDSRCPSSKKIQCKWGGNAEVLLRVKQGNKKDTTITLNTHQKYETEIEIDGYNYKLIELTPYPKNHIGRILQTNYKAQILIEKR